MHSEKGFDEAWNFGPERSSIVSVQELLASIENVNGKSDWKDVSTTEQRHEAQSLSLDISKARFQLGWRPALDLNMTVSLTMEWYREYSKGNVKDLCYKQIQEYTGLIS
jgi:CDP-glucose 4,6-dehydratase